MGIRQLVVTGCTTSVCVESTIRDAMFHDYNCVLLVDCTVEPLGFGFPRSNHEGTLFMVERLFGSILKSLRLLPDLRALHPFA
jgi:ureidoacrylate peracid hydrolase